jgi:hypothetical protein
MAAAKNGLDQLATAAGIGAARLDRAPELGASIATIEERVTLLESGDGFSVKLQHDGLS